MIKKLLPKNNYLLLSGVILAGTLFIAACGNSQQPPAAAPVRSQTPAAVPPKPVQKPVSSAVSLAAAPVNTFDFSNKKDPFKPFVVVKAVPKNVPGSSKNIPRTSLPIHSYAVNEFKLIGIITGGVDGRAMVTDPGGKGYVLKVGMLIGKNNGKVVLINSSGVDVLEQFRDDNGRLRRETIKLTLPRKQ